MRVTPVLLALMAAACAAPRTIERGSPVPLSPLQSSAVDPVRDASPRADADRSPYVPPLPGSPEPIDSAPVSFRSVVQIVEVPVTAADDSSSYAADRGGYYQLQPMATTSSWRSRRGGWFPVGTVMGAGIGAVIGNQSGHRGRGAFIGSNVGLLFDMARWFR